MPGFMPRVEESVPGTFCSGKGASAMVLALAYGNRFRIPATCFELAEIY